MDWYDKEMQEQQRLLKRQDNQILAIQKAEAEYKETKDADKLVAFWENLIKTEGILLNGVSWPFKLTEAYYRAKRYDNAWRELDKLSMNPRLRKKARQWQIKILKKEKKDYSHIQHLLDTGQ